jgi:hypothetical protein
MYGNHFLLASCFILNTIRILNLAPEAGNVAMPDIDKLRVPMHKKIKLKPKPRKFPDADCLKYIFNVNIQSTV